MEYQRNSEALLDAVSVEEGFATYLKTNWLSNPAMWCCAFRKHLMTLGNNTTNRIESFNSQVKSELRKRRGIPPSLPELVAILLEIVSKKDADASYKQFRNCATVASNALLPEMSEAGALYNDAGFKLLQTQVVKLKSKNFRLHVASGDNVTVEDGANGKQYELSNGPGGLMECPCTFNCAHGGLPCSHVLFYNQERHVPLFQPTGISDRWRRTPATDGANDHGLFDNAGSSRVDDSLDWSSASEDNGTYDFSICLFMTPVH